MDGGASGAEVWLGSFRNKPAILKLYIPRNYKETGTKKLLSKGKIKKYFHKKIEDIFRSQKSMLEKRDAYIRYMAGNSKAYVGDGGLQYIRSVRDVYINISLKGRMQGDEPIAAKLYDYGFIKKNDSYQIYMVTENLKVEGYDELKNFKPEKNDTLSLKILLQLLKVMQVKYESFVSPENEFIGCHRDLHPGNIFYSVREGRVRVKLIDFDLSITNNKILNRMTNCDRKTMKDGAKSSLGQINKTTTRYTWSFPKFRLYRSDADLYQIMAYWLKFSAKLPNNVSKEMSDLKKKFETSEVFRNNTTITEQKTRFFNTFINGLEKIKRKQKQLKF